jgi:hypothetical protein
MAIKSYSWGKAAQNGKRSGGNGSRKSKSKAASAGVKKTKKIKTGY